MALPKLFKSKVIVVNLIIIIIALFIAIKIYQSQTKEIESWQIQIEEEQTKQKIGKNISKLDNRLQQYRNQYVRKDTAIFMNNISNIAKELGIEIVTLKPAEERAYKNYTKPEFSFTVRAPNYETLVRFINRLEINSDFYTIEALDLSYSDDNNFKGLTANLSVSSIAVTE